MFNILQDELRDAFSDKKYDILFNSIKKILPLAKQQTPEKWFRGSSLFRYFPCIDKTIFIEHISIYFGKLSLTNENENENECYSTMKTRDTIYIYDVPDNVSPWYYYSTGVSNYGENFPGFFFVLDEQSLISDFPYRPVFPKKATIDNYMDDNIVWKKEILGNADDKGLIIKLLKRFIRAEDILMSIVFGSISSELGLRNGWENTEIISKSDYHKIIRYLANKKDIEELTKALNFRGIIGYDKN